MLSSQLLNKIKFFLSVFCFCACSKHIPAEFEVVSMNLSSSNNTGETPYDANNDSIPKKAYVIKMTLDEEMRKKRGGDAQDNGSINEDQLTSLNISSLSNFDGTHPAGSSLNSYFLTGLNSSSTISEFISKGMIGKGKYDGGNYLESWSSEQYLYLMTPPSTGSQTFVVEVGFSDGRYLKDSVRVKLY
jgi:hypothetical protein